MKTAKGNSLFKTGFAALAVVFLVAIVIGCSGDAPFAPVVDDQTSFKALNSALDEFGADPFELLGSADDLARRVWYLQTDADFADVGVDGGTIYLELGAVSSVFDVPPGAVCEDAAAGCFEHITAKAVFIMTPYGSVVFYNFGPDGLVFAEDCTLLLDTRLPEGAVLHLFWFNPDTGAWEVEQRGEADKKGIVEFEINHFSKYAIS